MSDFGSGPFGSSPFGDASDDASTPTASGGSDAQLTITAEGAGQVVGGAVSDDRGTAWVVRTQSHPVRRRLPHTITRASGGGIATVAVSATGAGTRQSVGGTFARARPVVWGRGAKRTAGTAVASLQLTVHGGGAGDDLEAMLLLAIGLASAVITERAA